MIQENILELVKYGLSTGLVDPEDKVYTINRLLELFQVDEIEDAVFEKVENLPAWTQEEALALARSSVLPAITASTTDLSQP